MSLPDRGFFVKNVYNSHKVEDIYKKNFFSAKNHKNCMHFFLVFFDN